MEELKDILEGCRNGDAYWQHRLYETYSSRFYAFCLRYATSEAEAEDMLVEGFTKVFHSLDSFRGEGSFVRWMYRIFTRVAITHYRQNRASREMLMQEEVCETGECYDVDISMDLQNAMRKALRELSEKQRVIFNLVAIEGYSVAEVADDLSLPKSTVRHCYNTAKETMCRKLRHLLDGKYFVN